MKVLHEAVLHNSSGSLQWVVLVVKTVLKLCRKGDSAQVLKSIKKMPSELSGLYESLLLSIDEDDRSRALMLMQWVHCSTRRLPLKELTFHIHDR